MAVIRSNTYADRIQLISHSKGGLVCRSYLAMGQGQVKTVIRLIMCQVPHLGTLYANPGLKLPFNLTNPGHLNMYPLWPWRRIKGGRDHYDISYPDQTRELRELSETPLPPTVQYTNVWSRSSDLTPVAAITEPGDLPVKSFGPLDQLYGLGDQVVPDFSQRGEMRDPVHRTFQPYTIRAFQGVDIGSLEINGTHGGFLEQPNVLSAIFERIFAKSF